MLVSILLVFLTTSHMLFATITEIQSLSQIEEKISSPLSQRDWVIFDIDYTLLEPQHPAFQMRYIKKHKGHFVKEFATFTEEQRNLVPVIMVTQDSGQLTELEAPKIVQHFQDCGAVVLGFTLLDTATIPEIGSVPAWRSARLKEHGFHFNPPFTERIEFTEFAPFRQTYPLYEEGVLYANVLPSKGEVLIAFLNRVNGNPSRVILIDDTLENLQSVESALTKRGIPFLGLHYRIQMPQEVPQLSQDIWDAAWSSIRNRLEEL